MANRYWVGGTASWDGTAGTKWAATSNGTGGETVPTTADDVFFDASSTGTVTIATGNTGAKSINCTGFTGTITGTAAITVAGSITLDAGMTYTHTGTVTISGTGTLTTAGKTFSPLTVSGSGITVTLGDALTSSGVITVTQGTFTTSASNYSVTATRFISSNSNTRTVTFNGSTVTVNGGGSTTGVIDFSTSTNLTFNANTSQINITGQSGTGNNVIFNGGGQTFNSVSFTATTPTAGSNPYLINGVNTFTNLTFPANNSNTQTFCFDISANQTISGTLTLSAGGNATRRTMLRSNTSGTARTLTVNALAAGAADYDFSDITIAGTASPISGTRFGDCKNNSGITFDAPKTVYWNLAGTNNITATGWAPGSGGTPDINNFPLAQDTAIIDNTGAAGTLQITGGGDSGAGNIRPGFNLGTIDASNRTSAATISFISESNGLFIYGDFKLGTGITINNSGSGERIIFAGRTTQDILSNGRSINVRFRVSTLNGTVRLLDAINIGSNLEFSLGTFNANNYNVTALILSSNNSNTRTLTMGSGTWTLSGTGTVWDLATITGLTFNKDTANIVLSNTTTSARTFAGGGLTYNKLTIGGATGTSTLTINDANTFSELASTKTVAHTITFSGNQTVTTWSITGTSGNVVTLNSNTAGTARTLTKSGGGFLTGIDYLNVRSVVGSPVSDTWYIGANSVYNTTTPNLARGLYLTQRASNAIVVLESTSSTTWTVPSDWNNSSNTIHLIGGGGGGAGGYGTGSNRAGGGGGGGGGYTRLDNQTLTLGASITYQAGSAGSGGSGANNGTSGGTTSWNAGASTAGGGGGGQATTTPTSTGGTAGTGTTYNGGTGGAGGTSAASQPCGGGGGAGAGGPNGIGANGGVGSNASTPPTGGGGGGSGGGTNGGNASSGVGGTGGNNSSGVGGGAEDVSGSFGGGGGGSDNASTVGGNGIEVFSGAGSGGGAGGADGEVRTNTGGFYGGGGGGGGTAGSTIAGSNGAQGAIIITYVPSTAATATGNFLIFL